MMKKQNLIFLLVAALFLAFSAKSQSKIGAEYFKGTWAVVLKGTPDGDVKLNFVLENKNDSIAGIVQDSTGIEISKIASVELKDNEITLYFNVQGYDVNLLLAKKDEDHVNGSLMNMFVAEGERIKKVVTK
jgi:hypothetical protein